MTRFDDRLIMDWIKFHSTSNQKLTQIETQDVPEIISCIILKYKYNY